MTRQFVTTIFVILLLISCGGGDDLNVSVENNIAQMTWIHPSNISDKINPDGFDSNSAENPQVALSNSGDAVIVWAQTDETGLSQIYLSERDGANGAWTHPINHSDHISPDGKMAISPQVAINNRGDVVVIWCQYDSSNKVQVFLSEKDGSTGFWTHPIDIDNNISPDGQSVDNISPQVAINNNGDALVAWSQENAIGTKAIFISERNGATGVWEHPLNTAYISPDTTIASRPKVDINDSNDALVVWSQIEGLRHQIFISERIGPNATWKHPADVSENISPGEFESDNPKVSLNEKGDAIICWEQIVESNYQVFLSERDGVTGAWNHPIDQSEFISFDGSWAVASQLALNDSGNALITWRQFDSNLIEQIFISERKSSTSVWNHPYDIDDNLSPDGQVATNPQVVINNDGGSLVVWYQNDGNTWQTFYSERNDLTSAWITPTDVLENISVDGTEVFYPQVALNDSNNAIVVWQQHDGSIYSSNFQIYMSERK